MHDVQNQLTVSADGLPMQQVISERSNTVPHCMELIPDQSLMYGAHSSAVIKFPAQRLRSQCLGVNLWNDPLNFQEFLSNKKSLQLLLHPNISINDIVTLTCLWLWRPAVLSRSRQWVPKHNSRTTNWVWQWLPRNLDCPETPRHPVHPVVRMDQSRRGWPSEERSWTAWLLECFKGSTLEVLRPAAFKGLWLCPSLGAIWIWVDADHSERHSFHAQNP